MVSLDKLTNFKINSCLFINHHVLPSCLLISCAVFVTSPKLLVSTGMSLVEHGIVYYLKQILVGGLEPEACIPKNNNNNNNCT